MFEKLLEEEEAKMMAGEGEGSNRDGCSSNMYGELQRWVEQVWVRPLTKQAHPVSHSLRTTEGIYI